MKKFQFMSGETHVKLNVGESDVYCPWKDDRDTMAILLAVEVIKRNGGTLNNLYIPYLPYARQDRIIAQDEPFSLKVFTDLINGCGFKRVITNDVHSKEAFRLINNLESNLQVEKIAQLALNLNVDYLVCPDKGAIQRCQEINTVLHLPIIYCNKIRENGKVKSVECDLSGIDIQEKNILISDDCIAGGRTFIEVAKVLKEHKPKKIFLVVTHIDDETKINKELYDCIDGLYHNDVRKPNLIF